MRLETFPLILAALVALLGVGLIADARLPDRGPRPGNGRRERRRAPRVERHRGGETLVGLGVLALAAALAGRDTWRYSIVAAIAGALFVLWGAVLNRRFFATVLTNRGALRRREPGATRPSGAMPPPEVAPAAGDTPRPEPSQPPGADAR